MFGINNTNPAQPGAPMPPTGPQPNQIGQVPVVPPPGSMPAMPQVGSHIDSTMAPQPPFPMGPPPPPAPNDIAGAINSIAPPLQAPQDSVPPLPPPSGNQTADDLLSIKHQALQSLTPLLNHIDQTPEEKFKTTMMMIQATDNPQLLHEALTVANQIQEEKTRAQALLDIVNEINYFTQRAAEGHAENPAG
jgi:hypothetical protein